MSDTTRDALKLAQAALNSVDRLLGEFDEDNRWREFDRNIALAAIDAALAQQAEPVAVVVSQAGGIHYTVWTGSDVLTGISQESTIAMLLKPLPVGTKLYTAPPQHQIKVEKIPPRKLPSDDE